MIGARLKAQGRTLAVAESLTGGLLAAAFAEGDDASTWFRGGVVAYAAEVKHSVLAVPDVPIVSADCARSMAEGVGRLLGADVAVAVTGVGGPDPQDGEPPGTVWLAVAVDGTVRSVLVRADGAPGDVCSTTVDSAIELVRRAVLEPSPRP